MNDIDWCNPYGDQTTHFVSYIESPNALMLQPHFWKSVRMTFTFLKWGLGSPSGLPTLQSSIAGVKTPRLEAFFMSLESC